MAGKTFYLINAKATGANHMKLQVGGSAPATATTGTGWTAGTTQPTKYALMAALVERTAANFGASVLPAAAPDNTLGDCWRSESPLTGVFEAGDWTMHFPVIAVSNQSGQDGRIRVRVWKSASATGSGATELTGATQLCALVTDLLLTVQQDSWCTWSAPAVSMESEYLFIQVAWELTGAGTGSQTDILFRVGSSAYITTPNFSPWRAHPYHYSGSLFLLAPQKVFQAQVDVQTLTDGRVFGTSIKQYIFVKNITLGDSTMATIEEGMTITIGAISGGEQYGRARVRGVYNFSGTNVIMVWASPNKKDGEIFLTTDLYVTVWDDYRVWMKPPYAVGGDYYYDGSKGPLEVMVDCKPIANGGPGYAGEADIYWERVFDQAPVAQWRLNESVGSPTVADSSGHGCVGSVTGATLGVAGIGDGDIAARFDGVGDFINVYSASFNSVFNGQKGTLIAWIKPIAAAYTDGAYHYAVRLGRTDNDRIKIDIPSTGNAIEVTYVAGGTVKGVSKATTSTNWMCVAITWDYTANEVKIFFDGVQEGSTLTGLGNWIVLPDVNSNAIGANDNTGYQSWRGDIAHVSLFDVAKSPADIGLLSHLPSITVSFSGLDSFAADYDSVLGGYSADRCTGGTPTASSSNGANTPDKAFDDNTVTYWESVGVTNQSINYEWAAYDKHLRRVSLTASGTTAPKDFLIYAQYSHDGVTTRTVRNVKNQTAWGTHETRSFSFDAPVNAKKLTIYVYTNNGGASIRIEEIAALEEDRAVGTSPYLWDVKDGTIVVGSSTSEVITATFPPGFRWVKLTVTDTNGKTGVTRIPVAVVNESDHPPISDFEVVSQELAVEGQTIEFRVYENIPKETYPDGTLVMYWEREVYGGLVGSLAGPAGREHMKFIGWMDEEPTQIVAEETSLRRFTSLRCIDVAGKLQQLPGFNVMVERVTQTTPTSNLLMDHANIDRFVYLLVRWLSTAAEVADFIWSGTSELWQFPIMSAEGSSIYDMADGRCQAAVMRLTCNKFGQLVMRYDPIVLTANDRVYTDCLELLPDDYRSVEYTSHRSSRFHWLWGSALQTSYLGPNEVGGTAAVPIFVVAPGEAPGQGLGLIEQGEQLVQDSANLAQREGHRYNARLNAPFSNFTVILAHGGDNGIDPAEMKFVRINIPAEIAAQRNQVINLDSASFFLPFRVSIEHNHQAQTKTVTVEIEREYSAFVPLAVVYTPP